MKIAVASGKGGTGKTTIATNLAVVMAGAKKDVCYVDCDVEEPNGHIFLRPSIEKRNQVAMPVPIVDNRRCVQCGLCSDICRYQAVVCIGDEVLTSPELCHGCGGCSLVCPTGAIRETSREVGIIETGTADGMSIVQGRLGVGEAMSSYLVSRVKEQLPQGGQAIIDAGPGTSCPVVKAVKGVDLVLLVCEPTPFGLHDLDLALDLVDKLGLPRQVIINRAGTGYDGVNRFCRDKNVDVLAEVPDDKRIAQAYSRGELAVKVSGHYRELFSELAEKAVSLCNF